MSFSEVSAAATKEAYRRAVRLATKYRIRVRGFDSSHMRFVITWYKTGTSITTPTRIHGMRSATAAAPPTRVSVEHVSTAFE
jgi:hypothetical protein